MPTLATFALVALTALATYLATKFPPSHEIWQDNPET